MTIEKAKLYSTAQVTEDTGCEIPVGFNHGDFVYVKFSHKSFGECIFQCKTSYGNVACIGEFSLSRFTI